MWCLWSIQWRVFGLCHEKQRRMGTPRRNDCRNLDRRSQGQIWRQGRGRQYRCPARASPRCARQCGMLSLLPPDGSLVAETQLYGTELIVFLVIASREGQESLYSPYEKKMKRIYYIIYINHEIKIPRIIYLVSSRVRQVKCGVPLLILSSAGHCLRQHY